MRCLKSNVTEAVICFGMKNGLNSQQKIMIKEKIGLIPRYNWDYKFPDFAKAFSAAWRHNSDSKGILESVFGQEPILTGSGRTSLYIILKSLELPEGSGVGVPLFCCPVVFEAIHEAGLVPVFIDINIDDYCISASDLQKKIDSISAIIVVHLFGHPANMDAISSICRSIPIVEDCAHALFSKYKGKSIGCLSTVSFFSFRSGKYISSGEGSAIFCQDPLLYKNINRFIEKLKEWKLLQEIFHCTATYIKSILYNKPWYGTIGYPVGRLLDQKLNLTSKTGIKLRKIAKGDLIILNDRIESFFEKVRKQRENAFFFMKNLNLKGGELPYEKSDCQSNYYQFAIRFQNSSQRDFIADYLLRCGIDSAKYLDEIVDVSKIDYGYRGDCPNSEICSKTVLVVPNHYVLSDKDLNYIVKCLNNGNEYFVS